MKAKLLFMLVSLFLLSSYILLPVFSFAQIIAGGAYHSLAICSDSTVRAWGDNSYGKLGDNTTTGRWTPVQVVGPGGIGFLSGITAVATGEHFSLALKSDGTVWAWGYNGSGQLGNNTTSTGATPTPAPVQVLGPGGVGFLTAITAIAAASFGVLALKNDSTVWAWGYNSTGRIGDNTTTQRLTPVQVRGPGGVGFLSGITSIASGHWHSLAIKSDSTVWAWGGNNNGSLGDGTTTNRNAPVPVTGLTQITAIEGGVYHSIALRNDSTVWTWGSNVYGQLGDNTTTDRWTPVQVSSLTGITAVGGQHYSLALKNDNTAWAWGRNDYGQLGDGTITNSSTPVQMSGVTGISAIAAAAFRGFHSLVVKNDGTVWGWGYNLYGQLGNNTNTNSLTPVQASPLCIVISLPIELLSFTANCDETGVKINWTTASEINNDYFTIDASPNPSEGGGLEWQAIGTVKGAGNSSTIKQYEFTYESPSLREGKGWAFRLKQTDYDGKEKHFGPVSVRCNTTDIAIYPTISAGLFFITGDLTDAEVSVYSVIGEKIYEAPTQRGETQLSLHSLGQGQIIDISFQPDGIYFLTVKTEKGISTQKLIIKK